MNDYWRPKRDVRYILRRNEWGEIGHYVSVTTVPTKESERATRYQAKFETEKGAREYIEQLRHVFTFVNKETG